MSRPKNQQAWKSATQKPASLVAGYSPQRVLGHEAIAASVAGPEITDDIFGKISRSFRSDHGIGANRAGRQIGSARVGFTRDGRQDFSNCWHRDLLAI